MILTGVFLKDVGGPTIILKALNLELIKRGYQVIVLTFGTNVGGIPDFLEDKKTGLFCEIKNPKDIAEKIKEILFDNNLRKTLSKNGSNLVWEKYGWDKISKQMEKIYLKLYE